MALSTTASDVGEQAYGFFWSRGEITSRLFLVSTCSFSSKRATLKAVVNVDTFALRIGGSR